MTPALNKERLGGVKIMYCFTDNWYKPWLQQENKSNVRINKLPFEKKEIEQLLLLCNYLNI
ncbi:hypothetical protein NUACC21_13530 [Scytonema sp. NUACC21]